LDEPIRRSISRTVGGFEAMASVFKLSLNKCFPGYRCVASFAEWRSDPNLKGNHCAVFPCCVRQTSNEGVFYFRKERNLFDLIDLKPGVEVRRVNSGV
jgi:hypothetical protein